MTAPERPPLLDWPGAPTGSEGEEELARKLAEADGEADEAGTWPDRLWSILVDAEAPRWTLPAEVGGMGCDRPGLVRRYGRAAEGSLTAAFLLTQHDAAVRRLVAAGDRGRAKRWVQEVAAGRAFATVGISQLTTSRRHGAQALRAVEREAGRFRLSGVMPWVTGAARADVFVTGAALDDGRHLLIALPADREGVTVRPPFALAALQASCTSEVACEVAVEADDVLAGPALDVMANPSAAGTGGLETSALALGQARAALLALHGLVEGRDDLNEPLCALAESWWQTAAELMAAAEGRPDAPEPGMIRARANALVLAATQAFLTASKGTGFLKSEPAQRWARQALFFLVWSCPAPVARASMRDLAGLCEL